MYQTSHRFLMNRFVAAAPAIGLPEYFGKTLSLSTTLLIACTCWNAGWAQNDRPENGAEAGSSPGESVTPVVCQYNSARAPDMVILPPGKFMMGSDAGDADSRPAREVSIAKAFALGRCEVTVAQFRQFVEASGYVTDAEKGDGCFSFDSRRLSPTVAANWRDPLPELLPREPDVSEFDQHPVSCVSKQDALAYIVWINNKLGLASNEVAEDATDRSAVSPLYRLPTEAEFEFAMRHGTGNEVHWTTEEQCQFVNSADESLLEVLLDEDISLACNDGHLITSPVGSYSADPFGLFDLFGNVEEWVEDCWHADYSGAPSDGSAWVSQCLDGDVSVLRGGSWLGGPEHLQAARRLGMGADTAHPHVGFRLARSLP